MGQRRLEHATERGLDDFSPHTPQCSVPATEYLRAPEGPLHSHLQGLAALCRDQTGQCSFGFPGVRSSTRPLPHTRLLTVGNIIGQHPVRPRVFSMAALRRSVPDQPEGGLKEDADWMGPSISSAVQGSVSKNGGNTRILLGGLYSCARRPTHTFLYVLPHTANSVRVPSGARRSKPVAWSLLGTVLAPWKIASPA
ncbi:hypothetical protein VUR80DRAFT_8496 [Thermomyces stellatus]